MSILRKMTAFVIVAFTCALCCPKLEAITYVTDTGGYAYDESRAVTNLAPAIALGTVAIVGIIAIAVQNSHDSSSSSNSHSDSYNSSCRSSYSCSCHY